MTPDGGAASDLSLSKAACALRRVEAVVNPLSGSANAQAVDEIRRVFDELSLESRVQVVDGANMEEKLRGAVDAKPDLLVVLAGDGTARAAANLCGMDGPLLAPLPGGTMNMLPHAIYGPADWRRALRSTLTDGVERVVSGGEVDGHRFYVAAILGSPALWAEAREAARHGKLREAIDKGRAALRKAFAGHLRFSLDGRDSEKTEALTLMCPLVSRGLSDDAQVLEAAAVHPANALEAFRLAMRAAAADIGGDWRQDSAVDVRPCRKAVAWANGRIPAILDGEPVRLGRRANVRFVPRAFRVLAPPHGRAAAASRA